MQSIVNELFYEPESDTASLHPIVGVQYTNTFTYFTTLTTTIMFLLSSPTIQFFVFDQFNKFSTLNLIWFFASYFIGIYVIIVVVASETMQKIFLYWSHYV